MKELKNEILRCCKKMCMADECDVTVAGQLTDMLKDVAEAEYYCAVTKAMEEYGEEPEMPSGYEMPSRSVSEIVKTLREMWLDADPDLRKKMKQELTNLLSDMS